MKKIIPLALTGIFVAGTGISVFTQSTSADELNNDTNIPNNSNTGEISQQNERNIVKHIVIDGAKNISQDDILKYVKETKVGEQYSKDKVQIDLKAIMNSGIVQNIRAKSLQNNGELYVVFEVTELSDIKNVNISGNTLINSNDITDKLLTKAGDKFNKENIDKDTEMIKNIYQKKGYIAIVSEVNNTDGNVTFKISEAKISSINYSGNTKTKSWVIDKTVKPIIKTGDFLTTDALQNLYLNLMSTGYFKDVKINAANGENKDDVILNLVFTENKSGEWKFGGGYSDQYKGMIMGGIKDNNLNGTGQKLGLDFSFGKNKSAYQLNFIDPYYKKTDTTVYGNIFRNSKDVTTNNSNFTENHTGATIGMEKPISKDKKTKFFSNFTIDHISTDYISGDKVDGVKSNTLTLGIARDERDNVLNPTKGSYSSASVTTSQKFFGSDNSFTKFAAEYRQYAKISAKDVLAGRFAVNYSPNDLPTVEQFSIGGADSVRGLDENAQRGNRSVLATLELRHNISDTVQGVVFVDAGQAWQDGVDNALKVATGLGIRVKTAMGILRLDAAKTGGEGMKYMFGIGQSF